MTECGEALGRNRAGGAVGFVYRPAVGPISTLCEDVTLDDESWDEPVAAFWASAEGGRSSAALSAMRRQVEERPADSPATSNLGLGFSSRAHSGTSARPIRPSTCSKVVLKMP